MAVDAELLDFDRRLYSNADAWGADDVGRWLEAEGFAPEVVAAFMDQEVDGMTVIELGMRDLEDELRVRSLPTRKRIMASIAKLIALQQERQPR